MTPQELSVRNKQEVAGDEQTRPGRTYAPDVDICETRDSLWPTRPAPTSPARPATKRN